MSAALGPFQMIKTSAVLRRVADLDTRATERSQGGRQDQLRCIAVTSAGYLPVVPFSPKARVMSHFMIDVESDGPIPGDYSMICFGAVLVNERLDQTFYGRLKPISEKWIPEALAVSGHSREETLAFDDPRQVMQDFTVWLKEQSKRRPLFISDNNGFDWQFINWYFWHFMGGNPFGHSSANLGSLYKGLVQDTFQNFKHLRKTAHTHHPVDDAKGNAEALLEMKKMGLKISF
jgi:hypothetical protein